MRWNVETIAEIALERQAELAAGLHQAEESFAAVAAGVRAGGGGDLAVGDPAADVVLRAVGVERDFRPIEDSEQLGPVGMQPAAQSVEACWRYALRSC